MNTAVGCGNRRGNYPVWDNDKKVKRFRKQPLKRSFQMGNTKKLFLGMIFVLVGISVFAQNETAEVAYSVHASNVGWTGYSSNGETSGTTGQGRQIEAIKIRLISDISGDIRYNVHIQEVGWMGWSYDNDPAGTIGQKKRMEAIRIQLTGQMARQYDVRYRVHMANVGWSGWMLNGDVAGTTGQGRQIEAIQIVLDPK
jgi:uncharacterized protein YjdB